MNQSNQSAFDRFRHELQALDFRGRANFGLAVAALVILTPFGINNFMQERYTLGGASFVIVSAVFITGWMMSHKRDPGLVTLLVVVPAILGFLSLSLQEQGVIGVLWSYPAVVSFFVVLRTRLALLATLMLVAVLGPQAWLELGGSVGTRAIITLLAVGVFTSIFLFAILDAQKNLEELAITDALTGLRNRVTLNDALNLAIQQHRRSGVPMTLLAIDMDHFKKVNDELGHAAGDQALVGMANILRRRFRQVDQIFRYGGEEFLVLLDHTGEEEVAAIAEEVRSLVESEGILPERTLTASIGVATINADDTVDSWMHRADVNLYAAKEQGRNRVVIS